MMVKEQVPDDPAQMPGRQSGYNINNLSRHSSHRSMHTHEQELVHEQLLGWGAMFGDVALVTNRNYFTTTTARGKAIVLYLLCLSSLLTRCNTDSFVPINIYSYFLQNLS